MGGVAGGCLEQLRGAGITLKQRAQFPVGGSINSDTELASDLVE